MTPGEPKQDVFDRQDAMYADRRRREALEGPRCIYFILKIVYLANKIFIMAHTSVLFHSST